MWWVVMTDRGREKMSEPGRDAPGFLDRFKEFGPASFAVEHKTSVVVLLVIIALMGVFSYRTTPKESFPELPIPMIAVNTMYPGVSPEDVESQITRVIEEDLSTISEIDELRSTSVEGYSSIVAEFGTSINLDEALQKVREQVDLAKPDLPADAEEPSILEFNFSEVIPNVLRADLRGGLEREVKVDVDLVRLQFYGLALKDLVDAIRSENVNVPGGSIDVGSANYLLRVDGEFENPAVIEDLVVSVSDGRPVYVRDVASVDFGFADRDSYARLGGNAVVTLDVVKRAGANIIETSAQVNEAIGSMEDLLPPTTRVEITSDQTEQIEDMVSSLENNILSGLILIVAVLLFFLGLGNSVFVAISIPASMFLSFIVLKALGVSMNMVVLFSLILALGMLVDNAIVVVENIYRFLEEGWNRVDAAKKATGEVALPVIAATATTLAAFAPLLFWPGEVGSFMGYLPKTLITTLTSSLFVALVIVPTLCAMFMKLDGTPREPMRPAMRWTIIGGAALIMLGVAGANPLTAVLVALTAAVLWALHRFVLDGVSRRFQDRTLPRIIDRTYEPSLRWALNHRMIVLGGTFAAFLVTATAFSRFNAGVEYFPESMPPAQIIVDLEAPVGTRAEVTDDVVQRIEGALVGYFGSQDWESVVAVTGGGGGGGNPMGGGPGGPEAGRVTVSLVDFQDRDVDAFDVLASLQESLGTDIAGATVTVDKPAEGPAQGSPLSVEIVGEESATLKMLSDRVLEMLEDAPVYPKLVGLESDLDEARAELSIHVDRERAALYDLSTMDVGNAVRGAINGVEAAKYRTGNDEYDIIVRLAERYRQDLESLRDLTVMAEGGIQVPLVQVADWTVEDGYGSIKRKDQERMATITSDVAAGLNSNAVLAEVQQVLADFQENELPPGYTLRYTGQSQDQAEAQAFLGGAFLTALLLIAFILISQFNSVVKPIIILTSVVMSTVGVLIGLMVFRMPFGIINTGVGIISLAGIVVNNAIILIDYIDILRSRDGMNRQEALVQGGKTRFRPVVLTAITTALGLAPLAIGLNFDFFGLYGSLSPELYWGGEQAAWWGPMAVAIIAGVLFATFLTLVLVPVMYSLVDDFADFFRRHYLRDSEEPVQIAGPEGTGETSPEVGGEIEPWVPEPEPAGVRRGRVRGLREELGGSGLEPAPEAG
jgi:multidrug efflux pump subunit AcrB